MIDLYTWTTPNGFKPLIALEELGLPYRATPVNLSKDEQHGAEFLALNPNGKIPAIVDRGGGGHEVRVFESGAILVYLAEKAGRLLPKEGQPRADALAWLMFQMSAVGPMFGQWGHFLRAKRDDAYAFERFEHEAARILGVLDGQLAKETYLAGDYSIADIATYPWLRSAETYGMSFERVPNVRRWLGEVGSRAAVQRAMAWKP